MDQIRIQSRLIAVLVIAALLLTPAWVKPAAASGGTYRGSAPAAGGVLDHTLIMRAIFVNHVVVAKSLKQVKPIRACFNASIPNPNPACQWPDVVRMSTSILATLLSAGTLTAQTRSRTTVVRQQLLASRNSFQSLSPADNVTRSAIYTHLRGLPTVNAMIQYLSLEQSRFLAAKRTALATGTGEAAQILKDGQSTIYSAAWVQRTVGAGAPSLLLRTVPESVSQRDSARSWKLVLLGIAASDAGGAIGGALAGLPVAGVGAVAGALLGAEGASIIAEGGTLISLGV